MMLAAGALIAGLALAGIGGDFFVRGLLGIARWLRVAPGIVGLTFAAFATSSPELSVSVNAAVEGRPQIGLGDAIGSNVVNVALIFGLVLLIGQFKASSGSMRRDFPVALLVPALTLLLILDGELTRIDGILMLALFIGWLTFALVEAWRQRSAVREVLGEKKRIASVLFSVAGLAALVAAGRLIVIGGTGIGQAVGLDPFVVGAAIVALGTSIPELATAVISSRRGHGEVGLGTILGSNIFNGLFIVSVLAIIQPVEIRWQDVAVALGFGAVTVAAIYPRRSGIIGRRRGFLLLALYLAFVVTLLQFQAPGVH